MNTKQDQEIQARLKRQYPKAWELMQFLRKENLLRAEAWSYQYEAEWMPRIIEESLAYYTKEKQHKNNEDELDEIR